MKFKTDIQYFEDEVRERLVNDVERATLIVRPGVTFQGVEVFLYDKVTVVPPERFRYSREKDELGKLAAGVLYRLRRNHPISDRPENYYYRVKDLEHEIFETLLNIVRRAFGKDEASKIFAETTPSGGVESTQHFRQGRQRLANKLVGLLQSKKPAKKKKETVDES